MPPVVFLSVTVSRRGPPEVVVHLRGEHDLVTVTELSAAMARAITLGDADLVVDLSRVDFMGAATVGVFLWARELLLARARSLVLRAPSSSARRVLELCDLDVLLASPAEDAGPGVEVTMLDRFPKIVAVGRPGTRRKVSSYVFHRRAHQQPARAAG
ncbi:MAG TPA: STAS domain-containing protein [Acidimicrobiales bacterium]|nr:STAS domain-containing protein [Acidimicrobiales bacterium]